MGYYLEKSFTVAADRLSKEVKAKVLESIIKFDKNELTKGLHIEQLKPPADDYCSLRVDKNYRAIYLKPSGDNPAVFVYVDTHDKAYEWAKRVKIITDGPIIGPKKGLTPRVIINKDTNSFLFRCSSMSDSQLKELKVPKECWDILRFQVKNPNQLIGLKEYIDDVAYYALECIMSGDDIEDALDFYRKESVKPKDIIWPTLKKAEEIHPIFEEYSDQELLGLGVPYDYIDLIRIIKSENELSGLEDKLPTLVVQALYSLYHGVSIEDVRKLVFGSKKAEIPDTYKEKLTTLSGQAEVVYIPDDESLKELFDKPMESWRTFLHPSQRELVERHFNGPARVLGRAGTGKTVVIIHRAKYLADFCEEGKRILITTYNKTLAEDIIKRLRAICSQEQIKKIDVMTVDKLTIDLAKHFGINVYRASSNGHMEVDPLDYAWSEAIYAAGMNGLFEPEFYKEEWKYVVQDQEISSLSKYINLEREGRGKPLERQKRPYVWKVFLQYAHNCKMCEHYDVDYAQNICAARISEEPELQKYTSILVDECQDLGSPALRLLRALTGEQHVDDIYFSGDSRQRIYGTKGSFSKCGINIRGRSSTLKYNYRTTAEIYNAAMLIQRGYLYDDLDGQQIEQDDCDCILHGEEPSVQSFKYQNQEIDAAAEDIRRRIEKGELSQEICVVARTSKIAKLIVSAFKKKSIETLYLSREQSDRQDIPGVRVATMHRVKGMEFSSMYILSMTDGIMPYNYIARKLVGDELIEFEKQEANLFSMAMTRAKKSVWISYYGKPSRYLRLLGDRHS